MASEDNQISQMFSYLASTSGRLRGQGQVGDPSTRHSTSSLLHPRSLWTKYCLLCTLCGSAATFLAGIFLVVAALFRYYTTSIHYFETVPTYLPAILLSICGVSTITFSCKRNRNIILLRITACWSLLCAALSSVMTITTSLIHMNRLQTLKECVYHSNPPGCTCYPQVFPMGGEEGVTTFVFENTPDCEVIHGILYSCLRAVFAISVVSVLLSIFLCMLLYQLIGHERKKAYWSRIRRINSDWSADFIACLARPPPPLGNERSALLGWGPPPPYEEVMTSANTVPRPPLRLVTSHSEHSFSGLLSSGGGTHPFSPTITLDPSALSLNPRGSHSQGDIQGHSHSRFAPNGTLPNFMSRNSSITSMSMSRPFYCGGLGMTRSTTNTSMSITSFSIPEEMDSSTAVTPSRSRLEGGDEGDDDLAEIEELEEPSAAETCRSLQSLDLDYHIDLLGKELERLEARKKVEEDLFLKAAELGDSQSQFSPSRRKGFGRSLPTTPLMQVRKALLAKGRRKRELSYGNVNYSCGGDEGRRRLEEGDEGKVRKSNLAALRSLPGSPARVRRKWGEFVKKKLSLDEDKFKVLDNDDERSSFL